MTFVFDLDGVVCIGGPFTAALEREHGIPAERLRPFFDADFRECILGRCDLKTLLAARLPDWGWCGSVEAFLAFWFEREHVICPQMMNCIRTLRRRGHRCVLGTNQERYRAEYLRREMGLEKEFSEIFVSGELGIAKPAAEFFRAVQERLEEPASNLCLIDDSEKNVTGARAMGWGTVHYQSLSDIARVLREAGLAVDSP